MTNNLKILFSLFCVITIMKATKGNKQTDITTSMIRQKMAEHISSKNQVNHIDRKQLTGGYEVLRKEKSHKLVLKELVQQNSYQTIAEGNSIFLQNSLKYSSAYQKVVEFAQKVVEVINTDIEHQLNQILEETLTKLLTLVNLNYVGQRGDQFYYLYDFSTFRSFIHDLKEKKIRFENLCKEQQNQNLTECAHNLSGIYNELHVYFSQFPLSQVTSPEFKDKYEEEINTNFLDQLDYDQIAEISAMHIKSIEQGNVKTFQELRSIVQDLVSRRNNVLSKSYESKPSKQKIYENIINFFNRQIVIKNQKDLFLNFYALHFIKSLVKVLGTAHQAEQNEHTPDMIVPFKSVVYERNNVEIFLKDAMALKDFLQIKQDKNFESLLQNVEFLIQFFDGLDDTYSYNYVLERLKDIKNKNQTNQSLAMPSLAKRSTVRIQNPTFAKKQVLQSLSENEKEKIRNYMMNYQQQVPKSELVKHFVGFRTLYEVSNLHKKRVCERSFYEFLESAAKMFLGSSPLNYLGQEINDFQVKLTDKILALQNCIDQSLQAEQNIQDQLQNISQRVQQLYRLNHDFVELKIEYKMDLIKKKLQIDKGKQDQLTEEELQKINDLKNNMKNNFLQQKNIVEIQYEKTGTQATMQPKQFEPEQINETTNNNQQSQIQNDFTILQPLHNRLMDDIQDNNTYDRPDLQISKLKTSQLYGYFNQIDKLDKQNEYVNQFKSYKKNIHYLISAMNDLNDNMETNTFGQGKKGNWVSFKFPAQKINELKTQLGHMSNDVSKIYSKESDDMAILIQRLNTYMKQNIHSTRGNYYEKEFIPYTLGNDDYELEGINLEEINLQNIEASKLYPIIKSALYHLNEVYSNNLDLQDDLQNPLNEFQQSLQDLLNDQNLELVQKMNKRQNKKLNYGKYKFNNEKVGQCKQNIDKILEQLQDLQTEDVENLRDDIEKFKNTFQNLKKTRAYSYESTDGVFDDEGNFLDFDPAVSEQISQEQSQSSQDQSNKNIIDDDIIVEQSIEESSEESNIPLKLINLEKIQHSKLYKPLKNIQQSKIKNNQARELYNHMASEFNEIVENEDLVKTAIRKIKKQKVKIGSYHYPSDKSNSFLKYTRELQILIEEQDNDEILKQDLKLVVNLFNTFLSTRKFYYEPFSATLVNDQGQEISKPLYDADFDKLNQSDFSMISNTGLDVQNFTRQSLVESSHQNSSDEQLSQEDSQESKNEVTLDQDTNIQKPQKKVRRRIYVMDILTCADCVKDGYVEIIRE